MPALRCGRGGGCLVVWAKGLFHVIRKPLILFVEQAVFACVLAFIQASCQHATPGEPSSPGFLRGGAFAARHSRHAPLPICQRSSPVARAVRMTQRGPELTAASRMCRASCHREIAITKNQRNRIPSRI